VRYERKILIFSTIYRKNTRNSLFPQCKTSIGNNSGSIKDRAVKFAYSLGFSGINVKNFSVYNHRQRSRAAKINRKMPNSTPCKIVTPKNFILKLYTRDYVCEDTRHANFGFNRYSGGFSPNRRNITTL